MESKGLRAVLPIWVVLVLALLLGSAVAYALHRFRFFGREAISFMLVLPLALPGIITGIALNSLFSFTGIQFGTATIVIGHTTFCIVVVFNNLIARLTGCPDRWPKRPWTWAPAAGRRCGS